METIHDWTLASRAHGVDLAIDEGLLKSHIATRLFTEVHQALLKIHSRFTSLSDYLESVPLQELQEIIDMPDGRHRTPLAWAVEFGLADGVQTLLNYGANPNQLRIDCNGGFSPLIHLAIAGPRSIWVNEGFLKSVKHLLDAGVDVNSKDHEGWTPLHIASSWSSFEITEMLIINGGFALDWESRTFAGESIFDLCDNATYEAQYVGQVPHRSA